MKYTELNYKNMIFNEIYSTYFNAVSHILAEAVKNPVDKGKIREIVAKYAFSESIINIEDAFRTQKWQLLMSNGSTPVKNIPDIPVDLLEKRWLKAVSLDPRIKLFNCDIQLDEVEPLFTPDDYYVFDKYSDGDPYEDGEYIKNFQIILKALERSEPLDIHMLNKKSNDIEIIAIPEYLEYSEKDDKFRLIVTGSRNGSVVNLGRIRSCEIYQGEFKNKTSENYQSKKFSVTLELKDERNSLERVMLHFSHYEKYTEKIDDNNYRVKIYYDKNDETEIIIRVLSFGPLIKVTKPRSFVNYIKKRLISQKKYVL